MLKYFTIPFTAMGSSCEIKFYTYDSQSAKVVAETIITEVNRLEDRYSRYKKNNLLYNINRVAQSGGSIDVDEETAGLFTYADSCYKNSDGLFDISSGVLRQAWDFNSGVIPEKETVNRLLEFVGWDKIIWQPPVLSFKCKGMELDFGGIVKEYAADHCAILCMQAGIQNGFINLGGDIRIIGPHPDGKPWSIGVRHPRNKSQHYRQIQISSGSVSSSGDYERSIKIGDHYYNHILNPKTGWPVRGLASVSVIADLCLVAGSVSTIAMLKENEGKQWLESSGLKALWVDIDGSTGEVGGIL